MSYSAAASWMMSSYASFAGIAMYSADTSTFGVDLGGGGVTREEGGEIEAGDTDGFAAGDDAGDGEDRAKQSKNAGQFW